MKRRAALSLLIALAAILDFGCTPRNDPASTAATGSGLLNMPGVYQSSESSVTALGTLVRVQDSDLGYWILADEPASPLSSALPPMVAVIGNPEDFDLARSAGRVVMVEGEVPGSKVDAGDVPEIRVTRVTELTSDAERLNVPRTRAYAAPGVYAGDGGALVAVGHLLVSDSYDGREWVLRWPDGSPQQMGITVAAVIANFDDLQLGSGLVAVEGDRVEDSPVYAGTPRIRVTRVLDAGDLSEGGSQPATMTVLDTEPARDAPGIVDLPGARVLAPPGIHSLPGGRSQVIGVLESYGEGEWRISTRLPKAGESPVSDPVVLGALETFRHMPLEILDGDYVVAEGVFGGGHVAAGTAGDLKVTSINRIENVIVYGSSDPSTIPTGAPDHGGKMLRGIPYRWARIEKPGLFEIAEERVRLVGVLSHGSINGSPDSWMVVDELPFWPGHFGSVAFLEEGFQPEGDAESWRGEYVAVEGVRIKTVHRHGLSGGESAVVRVETIERIETPEWVPWERFH